MKYEKKESEISNLNSDIWNPESEIWKLKSDIWNLESGIWNINIGLPKKFPVNIEAEISDDKTSSTISSDIPIQFKNVSETYASGSIEGGTIPIYLFSGKGHIIIREN